MVKEDKFTNDLDFIESLPECGKFVLNDWDKLRKEFERYIEAPTPPDDDGNTRMMYPIRDLYAYYMDTTDISPKFATSAILFLLSSCTRLEQKIITRQGDENFNLWYINIGQSTIMRKTTVERKNKKLLRKAGITIIPSKFTTAGMYPALKQYPQGALIRSEFSGLLSDISKEHYQDLPEALCEVYDCEPEIVRWTKKDKEEKIENPYITYWTSTQPANYEMFLSRLFAQGFLMRYLYCLELEKWTWYDRSFDPKPKDTETDDIIAFLEAINGTYITTVVPSRKTVAYNTYQDYCKKIAKKSEFDVRSIVYSYYGRVEEFVLKIAGILEISRSAILGVITEEDGEIGLTDDTLDLAVRIVRLYEQEFRKLIKEVRAVAVSDPVRTDRDNQEHVLEAIVNSEGSIASISELIASTYFGDGKLRNIVRTLESAGRIMGATPSRPKAGSKGSAPKVYWVNKGGMKILDFTTMADTWLESRDKK